jgi:hypothetical protein|tara:strand:- start:709 stop:903 length:195 start_codon:yes stop_codon:yes gene_type:complete
MIDSNELIRIEHILLTDRLTKKVLDLAMDNDEPIFKMSDHSIMCDIHVILEHLYKKQLKGEIHV